MRQGAQAMTESPKSISKALVTTAARHGLKEIAESALEITFDQVIKEGVLRDIPVVNTLANIVKAGVSVSEELFFRKLARFLAELEQVPLSERNKLLEKYPEGSLAQSQLGERLLLLLDKLNQVEKPTVLSRLFSAYIREEIDLQTFSRLAHALENFNLDLLPSLIWRYTGEGNPADKTEDIQHELSLSGLLTAHLSGSGSIGGSAMYINNRIGEQFLTIGFGIACK
jgi:hypothetical protein